MEPLSPSPSPKPPKPFRSYSERVDLLSARGMDVGPDPQRAVRKLSQIGYYRLSGFWYPCREIEVDQMPDLPGCDFMAVGIMKTNRFPNELFGG